MLRNFEEESFSTVGDACLHRAILAEERLRSQIGSGIVYILSIAAIVYVSSTQNLWVTLVMYLPIRDCIRAHKALLKATEKFEEHRNTKD